ELADDVAKRKAVVTVARARDPKWLGVFDEAHHQVPVIASVLGDRAADVANAGLVAEHLADRNRLLAVLGELGPVPRDWRLQVQLAAVREHMRAERRRALRRRHDDIHRFALPRRTRLGVSDTAPKVDDGIAVDDHADRGADLATIDEAALE